MEPEKEQRIAQIRKGLHGLSDAFADLLRAAAADRIKKVAEDAEREAPREGRDAKDNIAPGFLIYSIEFEGHSLFSVSVSGHSKILIIRPEHGKYELFLEIVERTHKGNSIYKGMDERVLHGGMDFPDALEAVRNMVADHEDVHPSYIIFSLSSDSPNKRV